MEKVYIVLIIVILLGIITIILNNKMMILRNNMKNAYSSLDVMLKKRYDLIPNLVTCVKEYMKHESSILEKLTFLRIQAISTDNEEITCEINNELKNDIDHLVLLAEQYPKLKSNINFLQLQDTLTDIEEQISAARRTYNAHVLTYNNFIGIIPINFLSKILGFKKANLFELNEKEKKNKVWMRENEK